MAVLNELDFFQKATLRICGSLYIEKALMNCIQYLKKVMPADWLDFCFYERDLVGLRMLALSSTFKAIKLDQLIHLPLEVRRHLEWQENENIRVYNSLEKSPVFQRVVAKYPQCFKAEDYSMIVMSMQIEGQRAFGDISLYAEGRNRYTEEDAQLFSLLNKPFAIAMSNALRHRELVKLRDRLLDDNRYLQNELIQLSGDEIIGSQSGLSDVMEMVYRVAPTDAPVLLLGETGVGKELIANSIQRLSHRRDGPFIKVNCGAIPDTLIDSELFGHEKGAFTGATSQKRGRFERAHNGTIFLDEIGELPPQVQVRLLRVLQNKEIERVGGTKPKLTDIRVICATNRNLKNMVKLGEFREDLFFRLYVFPIEIPPLKKRIEDVPALVSYFIEKKAKEMKIKAPLKLDQGAIEQLMTYNWPGNVRELENLVERALINNRNGPLTFKNMFLIKDKVDSLKASFKTDEVIPLEEAMSKHIRKALKVGNGKVQGPGGAAEILKIHPNTLRKRMKKLGILYGRQRPKGE